MRTALLLAAVGIQACQLERSFIHHSHRQVKRQETNSPFPPVLNHNEKILLDSFDSTSIAT